MGDQARGYKACIEIGFCSRLTFTFPKIDLSVRYAAGVVRVVGGKRKYNPIFAFPFKLMQPKQEADMSS